MMDRYRPHSDTRRGFIASNVGVVGGAVLAGCSGVGENQVNDVTPSPTPSTETEEQAGAGQVTTEVTESNDAEDFRDLNARVSVASATPLYQEMLDVAPRDVEESGWVLRQELPVELSEDDQEAPMIVDGTFSLRVDGETHTHKDVYFAPDYQASDIPEGAFEHTVLYRFGDTLAEGKRFEFSGFVFVNFPPYELSESEQRFPHMLADIRYVFFAREPDVALVDTE